MSVQFEPNNPIIQLCMIGMALDDRGQAEEADARFDQAWRETGNDFERFIAAYCLARHQTQIAERLKWLETALQYAISLDDDSVKSAYPSLYQGIARCYEVLGDLEQARLNDERADASRVPPTDKGPFYHGTRADLKTGDLLTPGGESNYQSELKMNHIYFTGSINGAGLAASLAKGEEPARVYIVEPTGEFENDPNVTDKKLPGNLTRSYRSTAPLRIVGEATGWAGLTPEELRQWREKLANSKGEIIN